MLRKFRQVKLSRSGFSLVEVVAAMAILTIAILGLIPMLAFNVKSNQYSKSLGYANFLAEKHLERVRAWPVYETTTVNGVSRVGIVSTNTDLFGTWDGLTPPGGHDEVFSLTSELYHNGYTLGDCNGQATVFASSGSGSPRQDDTGMNTGSTTNEAIVGDCASNFRGENFKVIRVTVTWLDVLKRGGATHSIQRQAYIAKF